MKPACVLVKAAAPLWCELCVAMSSASFRVTRPLGPVPCTNEASAPSCLTSFRTTGDVMSKSSSRAWATTGDVGASGAAATAAETGAVANNAGTGTSFDAAGAGVTALDVGAGAGAGGAGASDVSSVATTVPTSTVVPATTRISPMVPLKGEGTSASTFSVETSNSGSSATMVSPGALNHFVMVPEVMDSPSSGIRTSVISLPRSALPGIVGVDVKVIVANGLVDDLGIDNA